MAIKLQKYDDAIDIESITYYTLDVLDIDSFQC